MIAGGRAEVMALWSNLFAMLENVRKHVEAGGEVSSFDDPTRMRVGFRGEAGEWEISLGSVKGAKPSGHQEERLYELFRTEEGRRRLLRGFKGADSRKTIWEHLKEAP